MQQAYAPTEWEHKESVDLNILTNEAFRIQIGSLNRKGIAVEQGLGAHLPKALIDKIRLMQVVMNLQINGSEALEYLGQDNLEKKIWVKTFADNGPVGFEIEDNGIGIDQENIANIFNFGKAYQRSTGLNLYYHKMFVEDNGGNITINRSGSGVGTTAMAVFEKHA